MSTPTTTTNNLKFTATRECGARHLRVNIRLNDECRNGHEDFAITGDYGSLSQIERGDPQECGCLHDRIAKVFPEFKPFIALHLCDYLGADMHCVANARYHLDEGKDEFVMSTLRITPEELVELKAAGIRSNDELSAWMEDKGFRARYKAEADAAIEQLEALTGKTFESKATRQHWPKLTDEALAEVRLRRESGYYEPDQVAARDAAKKQAEIDKALAEIVADYEKGLRKLENDRLFRTYMVLRGYGRFPSNVIYYDHTNTISFNYNLKYGSSGRYWTQADFDEFVVEARKNPGELPPNVKFERAAKPGEK